ncbi:methyl-accepting chemotaxis sensory transducer [Marinospirillum alkaliphilum DSM 21637]|uniref:Methyl-accepting chemotaxis sensory transducer n=2 Tax=Marinospirillum TaxID=64968 RepID=A0A1K1YFW0_9GAMM|nr:methyl-accepting chemotaxis sensory transducer [Marinospirillum alkaliphilum DSM 21637]
MLGIAALLLAIILLIAWAVMQQIQGIVREAEERELSGIHASVLASIDDEARIASALAGALTQLEGVTERFAAQDRDGLLALLEPANRFLMQHYAVRQFQFHLPPATSFLRVHQPATYGDDLSGFRHTVVAVNRNQQVVTGLELGVAGLGIRGVVPVYHAGQHIGSAELGMSFGQPFFDRIKADSDPAQRLQLALHTLQADRSLRTFASTLDGKNLLEMSKLQQALQQPVLSSLQLAGVDSAVYAAPVRDFSGELIGVLEVAVDRTGYVAAMAAARNTVLGIGLVALLVGLLLAWLIGRTIVQPLQHTVAAMADIAEGEGDLTRRMDAVGRDELTDLARAFNRFAGRVQETVGQVAGSTGQLSAAAEQMSSITAETNLNIQQQRQEIEQVVAAMNEMTATVQEVARNAESAAASAREADDEAAQGGEVVTGTIRAIEQMAEGMENTSGVIDLLGRDIEGISSVLDVIRGVAEQTNLLALNAAIEAARAGEAGRGFAVVADEVRTLASRTQDSTQEIEKMIHALQDRAHQAVGSMKQSHQDARNIVQQAAGVSAALEGITTAIRRISEMNEQIASAAEEQSSVAEEINRNIININDVSEQTAAGASQTNTAGQQLAQLATDLQALVNRFRY